MTCFPKLVLSVIHAKASSTIIPGAGVAPKWEREQKWKGGSGCPDPAAAVMNILGCYESEDVACVAAAYTPGFQLTHNEAPDFQVVECACVFTVSIMLHASASLSTSQT